MIGWLIAHTTYWKYGGTGMATTSKSTFSVGPAVCPLRVIRNKALHNSQVVRTHERHKKPKATLLNQYLLVLMSVFANLCWKG